MSKGLVNCDTRVSPQMKEELTQLAKRLGVKRSDLQRAAFKKMLEFHADIEQEFEDGKGK